MNNIDIDELRFDANGLIPAVAQDANTGAVLMLAYMNPESIKVTLDTGFATYYSRSRQKLWKKGETSGNVQRVREIRYDCDGDALLLKVVQQGPACHTGHYSCFYRYPKVVDTTSKFADFDSEVTSSASRAGITGSDILNTLYEVILDRREHPIEGSYTNYLLEKGVEKIAKKLGEESSEVIIASMKNNHDEIQYETADLLYHLLVLLVDRGIPLTNIWDELEKRRK